MGNCEALGSALEWGGALVAIIVGTVFVVGGRHRLKATVTLREATIVIVGLLTYFGVRHLTESDLARASAHAGSLFDLERSLGIAWEQHFQASLSGSSCSMALMNWVYIWWHWPIILLTAIWLMSNRIDVYSRYRNAFLISGAIGLVIFAAYPVAPPRLLPDFGLVDTVTEHSNAYRVLQPTAFTNQYAAMPSLHFGWNLLIGIALVETARFWPIRLFGLLMPVAMFAAVIATANHFVLDPIAGAALALLGLLLASHRGVWTAIPARRKLPWRV